ncbi:MAG: DsbA family protein [Magnetovibrionaceae bacterium]
MKRLLFAAVLSFGLGFTLSGQAAADSLTAEQKQEIEALIGDYLKENPDVVIDAIRAYREREERADQERARQSLASLRQALDDDPLAPTGGNPDGDVTIVEFFDYRCGFCKRVFPTVQAVLDADPNVRKVYKEFPILGPDSVVASRAASAVWFSQPDLYPAFHQALMTARGQLTEDKIMAIASEVGLDAGKLGEAMKDERIEKVLAANRAMAEQLNITGTPAFVIGNQIIPGALDEASLKEAIARERARLAEERG